MVASEPSPISISPSPVITMTRRAGLRKRKSESNHRGTTHATPQVERARVVRNCAGVIG
jgi:hypothetical protein